MSILKYTQLLSNFQSVNMALSNVVLDSNAQPKSNFLDSLGTISPPFDLRFKASSFVCHYPENTSSANYRFTLNNAFGSVVQDISRAVLVVKLNMTKKDGKSKIDDNVIAAPCNNIMGNLFKQVKYYINNKNILNLEHYPVYSFFKQLSESTEFDRNTHLIKRLWIKDEDEKYAQYLTNDGFVARREFFGTQDDPTESQKTANQPGDFKWHDEDMTFCTVMDNPLPPITFMPTPNEVKIDLLRADDKFVLMAKEKDADVKINIKSVLLYVPTYTLNDELFIKAQEMLNTSSIRYYFSDVNTSIYTIGTGVDEYYIETMNVGQLPSQIYIMCQPSATYHGDITANSCKFSRLFYNSAGAGDPACWTDCTLSIGGMDVDGLSQSDPDAGFSVQYYKYFMLNDMLSSGSKLPANITPKAFVDDTFFFYFNLQTSLGTSPDYMKAPLKTGFMRCKLKFSTTTLAPITVYVMSICDAAIVMDKGGRINKETT